jgi:hypothetical protein
VEHFTIEIAAKKALQYAKPAIVQRWLVVADEELFLHPVFDGNFQILDPHHRRPQQPFLLFLELLYNKWVMVFILEEKVGE